MSLSINPICDTAAKWLTHFTILNMDLMPLDTYLSWYFLDYVIFSIIMAILHTCQVRATLAPLMFCMVTDL